MHFLEGMSLRNNHVLSMQDHHWDDYNTYTCLKDSRRSREKESNDEKRSSMRINESQMNEPEEAYH